MRAVARCAAVAALAVAVAVPARVGAQTFALDPASASLPGIPAGAGDLLGPALPPAPGPLPPPVVGLPLAALSLLPGDVIDALSAGDDGPLGSTLYFTVTRGSVGLGIGITPDVSSEVALVPPGTQPDASSDLFATFDPACAAPGFNSQVLDGDGGPPLAPLTCYPGFGLGLAELNALPGPPLNDQIAAFDWSVPGRVRLFCALISLAAGSPTLVPGTNPALPTGAEPGDILVACPGPPAFLGIAIPAAFSGLVSGGPGCAPPACDDVDAFAGFGAPVVSLAPGSPSLGLIPAGPADVLSLFTGPPLALAVPAGALNLAATDDVVGLELVANPCPIFAAADAPDFDGVAGCDNCPGAVNPGQEDSDGDGVGDACDPCTDIELDGFGNPGFPANVCPVDLCPFVAGPNLDGDGDGVGDVCDNCAAVPNPSQVDSDFDGLGDACDTCTDIDGDGYGLPADTGCLGVDNCVFVFNPAQTDVGDLDGVGDACDNCVTTPNPGQEDGDTDGVGNVCDNCPVDVNPGQGDLDIDLIGDACDICTAGVTMIKPQLKLNKLLAPGGDDQIQLQADLNFLGPTLPISPLDVLNQGMRVQVVDLGAGSAVLLDHTIPGGAVSNGCGAKDGWKTNGPLTSQKFGTKTDSIPPGCVPGSALGIAQAQAQDKTAKGKGGKFKVKGKNGTYAPAVGPFRMSVVLGGAAEAAMGQCGEHTFGALNCVVTGGGTGIKCK